MGDEQDAQVWSSQGVHALRYNLEGINIQAGICLVHQRDFWFEQGHLENLGALFLAAGEAIVNRAVDKAVIYFEQAHLLLEQIAELSGRNALAFGHLAAGIVTLFEGFVPFAHGLKRAAQEVRYAHAWDRHRILEGQKEAHTRAAIGRIFQDVLSLKPDFSLGHFIFWVAHNNIGEGTFSRAIGSHQCMNFTLFHHQVNTT